MNWDPARRTTASQPLIQAAATSRGRTGWIDKRTKHRLPHGICLQRVATSPEVAQGTKQETQAKQKRQCCPTAVVASLELTVWNKCEKTTWFLKVIFFLCSCPSVKQTFLHNHQQMWLFLVQIQSPRDWPDRSCILLIFQVQAGDEKKLICLWQWLSPRENTKLQPASHSYLLWWQPSVNCQKTFNYSFFWSIFCLH